MNLFTTKGFFFWGGIILVAVGLLGFFIIGPTEKQSIFGSAWWFDETENYAHLLYGAVALGSYAFLKDESLQKWIVLLVFVVAALATIVGFMNQAGLAPNTSIFGFATTNLENPTDTVLHLVVALWAGYVGFKNMGKAA